MQVDDRVSDVSDLIQVFESLDDHIADNAGGYFFAAHFLKGGLDFVHQVIDIICRYRALGTGDPDAFEKFFPVELFAGS